VSFSVDMAGNRTGTWTKGATSAAQYPVGTNYAAHGALTVNGPSNVMQWDAALRITQNTGANGEVSDHLRHVWAPFLDHCGHESVHRVQLLDSRAVNGDRYGERPVDEEDAGRVWPGRKAGVGARTFENLTAEARRTLSYADAGGIQGVRVRGEHGEGVGRGSEVEEVGHEHRGATNCRKDK
jgi:hypothetical protein